MSHAKPSSKTKSKRPVTMLVLSVWLASGTACESEPADPSDFALFRAGSTAEREPCRERTPLRRALFGDLHVHTTLSSDAWNYDLEVRPSDSYGYAFGEPVLLPPKDAAGRGTREVRIDRPLDFAAVTDHSEFLGELVLCPRRQPPRLHDHEPLAGAGRRRLRRGR
jgi:hypothetical protein